MQNWSILARFAKKIQRNRLFFTACFLANFPPRNFPWNRLVFLRICPENPSKFDFFPLKSREICRFFCEFWLFSRENPAKSADFSANLPLNSREILLFFPWNIRSPAIWKQGPSRLPLARSPEYKSSATLANSQQVCLRSVGILNPVKFDLNYLFQAFAWLHQH